MLFQKQSNRKSEDLMKKVADKKPKFVDVVEHRKISQSFIQVADPFKMREDYNKDEEEYK